VVHFAAYKAPGESMTDPARYFDNNVAGTLSLLRAMVRANVRTLVFSSTCAVYGTPKNLPVNETNNPVNPESPYGESKLMVEQMLKWFDAAHGLRSVCLRYFNAAGAYPDGSMGEDPRKVQNLVPLVMNAATGRQKNVKVFGTDYPTPDGSAVRDYIHVMDLAEAHAKALDYLREKDRSDVFNLGTGNGNSVLEVLNAARRITGIDIPAEHVARRPGDPVAVYADNTKARTVLGWTPQYGIEEIISSAWKWSSSHPDGYE
jgi:UDP-glucose 4-epimerase